MSQEHTGHHGRQLTIVKGAVELPSLIPFASCDSRLLAYSYHSSTTALACPRLFIPDLLASSWFGLVENIYTIANITAPVRHLDTAAASLLYRADLLPIRMNHHLCSVIWCSSTWIQSTIAKCQNNHKCASLFLLQLSRLLRHPAYK